jgi:hypothetical protein
MTSKTQKKLPNGAITQLALESGIDRRTLTSRIQRGWSIDSATTKPVKKKRTRKVQARKAGQQPLPPPSEFAAITPFLSPYARYFCGLVLEV